MPLIQPLRIYAYLFLPAFGDILEYKIAYKEGQYLIWKGELDSEMKQYYEPGVWRSNERLSDAIRDIVQDLRSLHKQTSGNLSLPDSELPHVYVPMIFEIQDAAEAGRLASLVIIGEQKRYKKSQHLEVFIEKLGFDYAKTVSPDTFLFGDFVRAEKQAQA